MPEIAFLGRSNVGKSTLVNAVVGRRALAHTSKTPGKTRTCNVYNVDDRYYLVDLPGYGYAKASFSERKRLLALVRDYLAERKRLEGVVWLLDVRREPSRDDLAIGQLLASRGYPVLVCITKADKFGRSRRREQAGAILHAIGIPEDQCIVTSARTRLGIADLKRSIDALVTSG